VNDTMIIVHEAPSTQTLGVLTCAQSSNSTGSTHHLIMPTDCHAAPDPGG